ncbi:MAG: nucleotidyltransferase family protein, partial [Clostridia bacterium]|nr:nucleotidyltransferase family protein [Clostridia bacterium]
MKISAVICEFNPFHNGHKYLLDEIRKQGYDC